MVRPSPLVLAVAMASVVTSLLAAACASSEHPPAACRDLACGDAASDDAAADADADADASLDAVLPSDAPDGDTATDADASDVVVDPNDPCATATSPYMRFEGDPTDPIWPGAVELGSGAAPATFTVLSDAPQQYPGYVSLKGVRSSDNLTLTMTMTTGDLTLPLEATSYPSAAFVKYASAGSPAFALLVNGRICDEASGAFDVHAISFDVGGHLAGLEATMVRYCNGGTMRACVKWGVVH